MILKVIKKLIFLKNIFFNIIINFFHF